MWDVNKYYDSSEYEEHWNLRKAFMIKHKKKFPEDRLVGLARIFSNMEFLGCVYNSDIMTQVQNLASKVDAIVEYRNRKKHKLQRTFVRASDAVKRHIEKSNTKSNSSKVQYVNFEAAKNNNENDDDESESKRVKIDAFIDRPELKKYAENITNPSENFAQPEVDFVQIGKQYMTRDQFVPFKNQIQPQETQYQFQNQSQQPGTISKTQQRKNAKQQLKMKNQQNNRYKLRFDLKPEDRALIMKAKSQNGILGKLVLYETQTHATPFGCLEYSTSKINMNMKIMKDPMNRKYILYMDNEYITDIPFCEPQVLQKRVPKGHRKNKVPEEVRNEISEKAVAYLKKFCFTVIDHNTRDFEEVSADNFKTKSKSKPKPKPKPKEQIELSMDGIGAKLMKQMGWSGKGLGKDADGIIEPIQPEIRVCRAGFGQGSNEAYIKSVRQYFENYLSSGETKRLVFSTDFNKEDRANLHFIAGQFGLLRSRSYGKGESRYITIERKLSGWDIIEQVLANDGSNDCYTLIKPTNIY